jgi:hypothetical protein
MVTKNWLSIEGRDFGNAAEGNDCLKARYFYGYNIVAAGFTVQAVCVGSMFAYGVFFKDLQAEFGWTRATLSGASSLAFFIMDAVSFCRDLRFCPRWFFHCGFTHGGRVFGTGAHGLLFGIILFCGTLGGAVGPLLAGRTYDVTESYQMVFLMLSVLTLIGCLLMISLRPTGIR